MFRIKYFNLIFSFILISLSSYAQKHEIGIEMGYGRSDYNYRFILVNPFKADEYERFELNLLYDFTFKSTNLLKIESGIDYLHMTHNSHETYVSYVDILSVPVGIELYPDKKSIFFFGGGFNFEKTLKKYTYAYNEFIFGGYLCAGYVSYAVTSLPLLLSE